MKTISIKRAVTAILTPFVILSCTDLYLKDIKDASFDTSLAIPIGSAKVEVSTFLESMDTTLISNATGEISIIWTGDTIKEDVLLSDLTPEPTIVHDTITLDRYEPFTTILAPLPVGSTEYKDIPKEDLEEMEYTINFDYVYDQFNTDENFDIKISKLEMREAEFDVNIDLQGVTINAANKLNLELTFPDMFGDNEKTYRKTISSPDGGTMQITM